MKAGQLRHLLTIKNIVATEAGDRGQEQGQYVETGEIWAGIKKLSGREQEIARQRYAAAEYEIICRYHPEINSKSKLHFGSRVFSVLGVENIDERNIEMRLLCGESNV